MDLSTLLGMFVAKEQYLFVAMAYSGDGSLVKDVIAMGWDVEEVGRARVSFEKKNPERSPFCRTYSIDMGKLVDFLKAQEGLVSEL